MNTTLLAQNENFSVLNEGETCDIKGVFCGDLLSWAMGRASEGDAWCTVMGNVNTIAVSVLADCACIILCHGSVADENMLAKAKTQDVCVLSTQLSEYEACVLLHELLN